MSTTQLSMDFGSNPRFTLYLFITMFSFLFAIGIYQATKTTKVSLLLSLAAGFVGLWNLSFCIRTFTTDPARIGMLTAIASAWAVCSAAAFFGFCVHFTDRVPDFLPEFSLQNIGVLTTGILGLFLSNSVHRLLFTDIQILATTPETVVNTQWGLMFTPVMLWVWMLMLTGVATIMWYAATSNELYQWQAVMIFIAGIIPIIGNLIDVLDAFPIRFEVTPTTFLLSLIPLTIGVFRYDLTYTVPIARERLLDTMPVGVVTTDCDLTIIEYNERAKELGLQIIGSDVEVGMALYDYLPNTDENGLRELGNDGVRVSNADSDTTVDYLWMRKHKLKTTVEDHYMFLFTDVTKQETQRRELKRQNERLDRFASMLSHDIRNPLNVAMTATTFVQERGTFDDEMVEEQLGATADSLDRIEAIIEDALTLARCGEKASDPTHLSLASVAREAWNNCETATATLTIADDLTFYADKGKAMRAFENLYRNSIEHAGPNPTITTGPLSDASGFYVEDDGDGIPEKYRDEIFEQGVTSTEEGTGFGLAIVREVAEAHGWTVELADPETGEGARFEFRNVPTTDEPVEQSVEDQPDTGNRPENTDQQADAAVGVSD